MYRRKRNLNDPKSASAVTVGLGWLTEIDCLRPVTETRHTMDAIFGRLEF